MRHIWIIALSILAAGQVTATDRTWTGATSTNWDTGTNWSDNTKPTGATDTAILGTPVNQAITNAAIQNVGGIRVDTAGFSLTNNGGLGFQIIGFGISGAQSFTITNNAVNSATRFSNTSTAAQATITNFGASSITQFLNNSTASQATITNSGASSNTRFLNNSTASQATITNSGADSQVQFFNDASAGQAIITNNAANSVAAFLANSSAENATLILNDGFLNLDSRTSVLKLGSLTGSSTSAVRIFGAAVPATLSVGYLNKNETFGGVFNNGAAVLSLTKEGTGTFVVTGNAHTYTGTTTVNNGTLQWDGLQSAGAGLVTINPMGTFSGIGRFEAVFSNHGTLSPGNPTSQFGVLRITDYSSPTRGIIHFNVSPTQNSQLRILGNLTLTNSICDLNFAAGRYNGLATKTLIPTAALSNITTFFDNNITGVPPRINASLAYGQFDVFLNLAERPFIDVLRTFFNGGNSDQQSLAGALDNAAGNPNISADFNNVIKQFNVLPQGGFLFAMDSIGSDHFNQQTLSDFFATEMITGLVAPSGAWSPAGGIGFASTHDYAKGYAAHARKSSLDRHALRARDDGGFEQAALALKNKHGTAMRDSVRNLLSHNPGKGHIWFQGFGGKMSSETTRQDLGFYANTAGLMMGLDYAVTSDLRMGVAGGYSHTNMDVNRNLGHSSNESPFGSVWANYARGLMDYDFGFTAKRNSIDNKRNITVLTLNRTATAHYNGYDMVPHLGVARHYWLHDERLHIKPFASVDLFYNHAEGFTETGANSLNLKVKERNSSLLQSSIGMGFDRHIHWCTGTIKPEIAVKYMNRAVLRRPRTQANFVDQNAFFVSTGDDEMKHRLGLNAEVSYVWKNGGTFKLGYHGDYGKGQHSHMGLISLGKSW